MHKANLEINDFNAVLAIMKEARVCRIGLSNDGTPYVVPMNFGLGENCIYLHCAAEGLKLDILRKNNKVCFEMDLIQEIKQGSDPCSWSCSYESVIGFGLASFMEELNEKRFALDRIMEHYGARAPFAYSNDILSKTTVIRIAIENLTGKRHD